MHTNKLIILSEVLRDDLRNKLPNNREAVALANYIHLLRREARERNELNVSELELACIKAECLLLSETAPVG